MIGPLGHCNKGTYNMKNLLIGSTMLAALAAFNAPINAQSRGCQISFHFVLKDGSHYTERFRAGNTYSECVSHGNTESQHFMQLGLYRSVTFSCACR
jgi:hypothetical protein